MSEENKEQLDAATAQALEIARRMREEEKKEQEALSAERTIKLLKIAILVLGVAIVALIAARWFTGGWLLDW